MPGTQFPAVFNLTNLNGLNGFKIDGEAINDYSGDKLGAAADLNGDGHLDIVIGAFGHNSNTGRSYVLFGGPGVGSSGLISLSSLNGSNGFKIDGEAANTQSGWSVNTAGDINSDSYDDLVIGADYASPNGAASGCSYVIFGAPTVGSGGLISLSTLNGGNGFKLNGAGLDDYSGYSVSAAGDINGDGHVDLAIGAIGYNSYTGRVYVVFGGPGVGAGGSINLGSLTLPAGFKLPGEVSNDYCGHSVSLAGDVNGDTWMDLIIGAYGHNGGSTNGVGRSYVVFGRLGIGSGGVLSLSNLNGTNGFKLDGEVAKDMSGFLVSNAGDINGDGREDLIIGAPGHNGGYPNGIGRSYVVFGGAGVGSSGVIALSSLTGSNGFRLDGEIAVDNSGSSVSAAGDINGDGYADLLIGANGHNSNTGRSYVVFGGPGVGSSGLISLSSLNGTNGFKLDGEAIGDSSGGSVNTVGDINGDGLADLLIGARNHNSNTGRTYVIFGDVAPQLINNQLFIRQGQTVVLTTQYLNATDNAPIIFNITGVQHGHFELISAPGQPITLFNQSQIVSGQVKFVHDNSSFAPSYSVQTPNTGIALTPPPQAANVTFYRPPLWLSNQLTIQEHSIVLMDSSSLDVRDDYPDNQIVFNTTSQYGQFELITANNQTVTQFTRQQLRAGQIQFRHTGYAQPPSYNVSMNDGYFTLQPLACNVTFIFINYPPVFVNNQLNILQGETTNITATNLLATDVDTPTANLTFYVSNLQHGIFRSIPQARTVNSFSQLNVSGGDIQFVDDGSSFPPYYQVTVSDGPSYVGPQAAVVVFNGVNPAPQLLNNNLNIIEGQSVTLTTNNLNALDTNVPASQVTFIISGVQHGRFERIAYPSVGITSFTLQEIQQNSIRFVSFDLQGAPSYLVSISDGVTAPTVPSAAVITYTPINHPPVLVNNSLIVIRDQSMILTSSDLAVSDPDVNDTITFTISNVAQGQFELTTNAGVPIITFSKQQINSGLVQFVDSGSPLAPSYLVSANDGSLSTPFQSAAITFIQVNHPPEVKNNELLITQGTQVIFSSSQLSATDDLTQPDNLIFQIATIAHGHFEYVTAPGTKIDTFAQGKIKTADIRFVHDGSDQAPSYWVQVNDGELSSNQSAALVNFIKSPTLTASSGIDTRTLISALSSIGGAAVTILGYMWWRRRVASHRRGFEFANNLRKAANLEYHDFMRFDGDIYKSKIENFLAKIDLLESKFYKSLKPAEKKSFAVCVTEIMEQKQLLSPSGYGAGIYGWLFAFSVGWSQQLNFKQFEDQLTEIAQQAIAAWKSEDKPTTRWPYYSPTCADKAKAWCCARPSRSGMFAKDRVRLSRSQGEVALTELKHQGTDKTAIAVEQTSASPNQELTLFKQQVTGQMQQVSGYLHQVSGQMQALNQRIDQLEKRPLTMGMSNSSS